MRPQELKAELASKDKIIIRKGKLKLVFERWIRLDTGEAVFVPRFKVVEPKYKSSRTNRRRTGVRPRIQHIYINGKKVTDPELRAAVEKKIFELRMLYTAFTRSFATRHVRVDPFTKKKKLPDMMRLAHTETTAQDSALVFMRPTEVYSIELRYNTEEDELRFEDVTLWAAVYIPYLGRGYAGKLAKKVYILLPNRLYEALAHLYSFNVQELQWWRQRIDEKFSELKSLVKKFLG